ncbi:MAG TPA: hypothetical protein VI750_05040 [Pyrinomonadaceae bacterium]|nr:hypothetical protein [Pyrinomonadaceae bacterium]
MRAAAWVLPFLISLLAADGFTSFATSITQKNNSAPTGIKLLTRTTTRREGRRFGYGGTVTVVGAPTGSITVEGWPRAEVEVVADIEQKAESEDDLARLATVNGFVFDDDVNHVSILTTGTHDKAFMRRAAKGFPKHLLSQPWKIDYRIRVPANIDLEINGGRGPIKLSGIEGAIRLSATEGDASLVLTGGIVSATIASGNVLVSIPVRSWRGGGADVRVATGTLTVELLPGFNGDIDAEVLRTGRIEDAYGGLESREKPGITETIMRARAGVGGAFFKFTVGAGTLLIKKPGAQ